MIYLILKTKATLILGILLLLFVTYKLLQKLETDSYKKEAIPLIEKVEHFKRINGELPTKIIDLGIIEEMDDGPYYKKVNNEDYIIYFNIGFDDRFTYYSKDKLWKYGFDK